MGTFNNALKYLEEKQFQKAEGVLKELLKNNPEDVNILYNLGMCYTELNQTQQAIEMLNKCIELAPKHSNAYVALSFAYVKENNLPKAKEFLLKAIEIDPNNSYALKNLGGIWGKLGDNVKALYFLKKSYDLNPDDPFTVYGLGVTYQELGDLEKKPEAVKSEKPAKIEKKSEKQTQKKVKAVKTEKPKKEVAKRKIVKKDNNIAHEVLLENLISEKSTMLAAENKYVFKVHPKAGKFQIKEAVEGYYGVQVVGVNTIKISPKKRIHGRTIGWKKGFKKAIVTLRQGDAIGAAEGV